MAVPPHPGKRCGKVRQHGSEAAVVSLSTQKVGVSQPPPRKRGGDPQAEVPLMAYEAMQSGVAHPGSSTSGHRLATMEPEERERFVAAVGSPPTIT